MATALKYPTSKNAVQKTLDAALLTGVTAAVTLNSVVGIQNKAGVFVVDRVDSNGTATPSKREYISFTGVSGSTLTTLTRNADGGGSDQDHAVGAIVEFVSDVLQEQAIIDGLLETITTAGALDTTKVVDLTTAQTLTNKTLTSPKIGTNIKDTNGNELITLTATGSAVNEVTLANGATGTGPTLTASGDDTNIDLNLLTKGTGVVNVKATASNGSEVRVFEDTDNGTNYVGLKAPDTLSASKTYTLPSADGTSGQALVTNGSGTLSFATAGSTDGWTSTSDSWSYASATTITVPSGAASLYKKGDKLKFTQTTVKYFYITTVADTLLTVTGGSDYTVANAAISAISYSHVANPIGFPDYFNTTAISFSTTYLDDGAGGAITSASSRFNVQGAVCNHFVVVGACTKVGTDKLFLYTFPSNAPVSIAPGSGAGVLGGQNVPFSIARSTSSNFYLMTANTVADNASIASIEFAYSYLF